jgi:type 1 glutamine amidotransferase
MAGVPAQLHLVDEVYGDMDLRPGTEVLMTARRTPDDRDQPVVWVATYGSGRVVYDGFGHDTASVTQTDHARLLRNAVTWVAGEGS